jgi:hypothetical protein
MVIFFPGSSALRCCRVMRLRAGFTGAERREEGDGAERHHQDIHHNIVGDVLGLCYDLLHH